MHMSKNTFYLSEIYDLTVIAQDTSCWVRKNLGQFTNTNHGDDKSTYKTILQI